MNDEPVLTVSRERGRTGAWRSRGGRHTPTPCHGDGRACVRRRPDHRHPHRRGRPQRDVSSKTPDEETVSATAPTDHRRLRWWRTELGRVTLAGLLLTLLWAAACNAYLDVLQGFTVLNGVWWMVHGSPGAFVVSSLLIWMVLGALVAVTGRVVPAAALLLVAVVPLGLANHEKLVLRAEPIYPSDLDLRHPARLPRRHGRLPRGRRGPGRGRRLGPRHPRLAGDEARAPTGRRDALASRRAGVEGLARRPRRHAGRRCAGAQPARGLPRGAQPRARGLRGSRDGVGSLVPAQEHPGQRTGREPALQPRRHRDEASERLQRGAHAGRSRTATRPSPIA